MVLQEKSDHQIVMAGAGYESTRQTISFSNQVAEMGADFVSILTPSYFKKRLTNVECGKRKLDGQWPKRFVS